MIPVRAVLFDIDGTLLNHELSATTALRATLEAVGPDLAWEDGLGDLWLTSEHRHMQRYLAGELTFEGQRRARLDELLAMSGVSWDVHKKDVWFAEYAGRSERAWTAYPDVGPCLSALGASGLALGVLSNGRASQQNQKLRTLGLSGILATKIFSSDVGIAKPDLGIFRLACGRLGLAAEEVVYVGDRRDVDVEPADACGMFGVWVDRTLAGRAGVAGQSVAGESSPADQGVRRIASLTQLPALLRGTT